MNSYHIFYSPFLHLISFITHHFSHCRRHNLTVVTSQNQTYILSFPTTLHTFFLLHTSNFFQFPSHISSSPNDCFYFSFHFLHQPFAIFTCISFHFIYQPYDHHYQHATETNTLFILNYFMSSSHCIPLLLLSFCFVIPMGEQYSFSFSRSNVHLIRLLFCHFHPGFLNVHKNHCKTE